MIDKIDNIKQNVVYMRKMAIEMGFCAKTNGAHFGGAFSLMEILGTLYSAIYQDGDKVILSKGHGSLAYYTALNIAGYIKESQLYEFEKNGGKLPGQPIKNTEYNIDFSSGSLGMGLSYATGIAISFKKKNITNRIYVILGDGECNEGIIWESAMLAGHLKLNNLIVIVDFNGLQSDGATDDILHLRIKEMFEACTFEVIEIDGHSITEIFEAFSHDNREKKKPTLILAHTIKGKGVSFMESDNKWHHGQLTIEQYKLAIGEINGV